jgi:hypothetical protein
MVTSKGFAAGWRDDGQAVAFRNQAEGQQAGAVPLHCVVYAAGQDRLKYPEWDRTPCGDLL